MKKLITWIVVLTMVLSLCACGEGSDGGESVEGLKVGYAKIKTTPSFKVGLSGYSNADSRKNTDGMADNIYATCIAAKEGDETLLMFTVDLISIDTERANELRAAISEAVDIPGEKMFFGATHCHSAPEDADQFKILLTEKIVEAAKKALEDLAPAKLSVATTQTENMTFVRHYLMADGSYCGSNFGDSSKGYVDHAAEADEQMIVVKFDRPEEKKDVVMVNFQAHNDRGKEIGYNTLAAGYVGPLRDELEAKSGCNVAFFTGASGNLNPESKLPEEANNLGWREYGKKLAEIAYNTMSDLKPVSGSGIASSVYTAELLVDHSWDHAVAQAQEVYNLWKSTDKETGDVLAKTYNFTSVYQARAILSRSRMGASDTMEQGVFRIHDLGFTVGSYEMFCNNAMAVKKASPFEVTFVITGNSGYIPTKEAFEYRSYEGDTGKYMPGTAEQLQDQYIKMLKELG